MVTVRSIRAADGGSVLEAFKGMDKESVYRRFFSPKKALSAAELKQLTDVDFSDVVALVVTKTSAEGELLIGGGRYAMDGPGRNRRRDRLHDQWRLSRPWHCVPRPQAPGPHRSRGRPDAVRGGGACRESADACGVSAERPGHEPEARRHRVSRDALASIRPGLRGPDKERPAPLQSDISGTSQGPPVRPRWRRSRPRR